MVNNLHIIIKIRENISQGVIFIVCFIHRLCNEN